MMAVSVVVISGVSMASRAAAQAGLRESLERLDRDGDGRIAPDEITPLSRVYLERIMKARRLPLDKPQPIDKLQEAARIYHALQNGVADKRIEPEGLSNVRPFGADPEQALVPEFGLGEIRYPYTLDDVEEADETLERYDRDGDGTIDRREAERAKWTHRNPFDDDLNDDGRLSRMELTQRYARRRLLSDDAGELVQRARRAGNGIQPSVIERKEEDRSEWWKRGGSALWLTASVMGRFDSNRNGRLESVEAMNLNMPLAKLDGDRDGEISRDEMREYVMGIQDTAGGVDDGIPAWFIERDVNQDGQIALSEYTPETVLEEVENFVRLDVNSDGLLTSEELKQDRGTSGGSFEMTEAELLPPRRSIVSELDVDTSMIIDDLTIQLSITHSHTGYLDLYLTAPDGRRVELCTEVGGREDNFEDTTFSDQARMPITKAKPPFEGEFLPEAIMKGQPGLSQFKGSQARGTWQLTVRAARSDRFGMLHQWRLNIRPRE
ncbi:MAG: proprotein convertase P-domain-containing protein [Planctomycetota bacterium]